MLTNVLLLIPHFHILATIGAQKHTEAVHMLYRAELDSQVSSLPRESSAGVMSANVKSSGHQKRRQPLAPCGL